MSINLSKKQSILLLHGSNTTFRVSARHGSILLHFVRALYSYLLFISSVTVFWRTCSFSIFWLAKGLANILKDSQNLLQYFMLRCTKLIPSTLSCSNKDIIEDRDQHQMTFLESVWLTMQTLQCEMAIFIYNLHSLSYALPYMCLTHWNIHLIIKILK